MDINSREGIYWYCLEVLGLGGRLFNIYIDGFDEGIKIEFMKFELLLNGIRFLLFYKIKIKFKMIMVYWENGFIKLK